LQTVTELYFKSVMQKGQTLMRLPLNLNPRPNSFAYKGLRSRVSTLISCRYRNFRFTTSANTKKMSVILPILIWVIFFKWENRNLPQRSDFEDEDPNYDNRQRLQVYFTDAKSFLCCKAVLIIFKERCKKRANNLYVRHQFNSLKINFTIKQRCPQR
jgi:hypothetical protein